MERKYSMLRFEQVTYSYQHSDNKALELANFRIHKGRKVALMGANGAGKSTAMCMMNGLIKPDSGRIIFEEKPIEYNRKALRMLRQNIGIVFQNPESQIFSGVVHEDVAYGPLNLGLSDNEVKCRVDKVLTAVGLEDIKNTMSYQLSFGQKQRIALAGVLAMEPKLLVLDEPTSGLDPQYANHLMSYLDSLHASGMTIVISSHDVERMWGWADYFIIMKDGRVLCQGSPEEVFGQSEMILQSGMTLPILYQIYQILKQKGFTDSIESLPKNISDMKDIVENYRKDK